MAGAYTFLITGEYSKETECFEFNKMAVSQQTITGTTGKSIVYVQIAIIIQTVQNVQTTFFWININTPDTKGSTDGKTWRTLETDWNHGFWKLVSLTVLQSSFKFVLVPCDIMLVNDIHLTQSSAVVPGNEVLIVRINRGYDIAVDIRNFSSLSLLSNVLVKYFLTLEDKFGISKRPCIWNVLLLYKHQ